MSKLGQKPQTRPGIFVGHVTPILKKLVGTGPLGRKPDRTGFRFPHLGTVRLGKQWASDPVQLGAPHAPAQIDTRSHIPPLITATNL